MNRMAKFFILMAIIAICGTIMLLPSPSDKKPDKKPAVKPVIEKTVTSSRDRVELVRHFEYVFKITDWRHVTTTGKDSALGVSDDELAAIEFRNDPVTLARLAVSLDGDDKEGGRLIIGFLSEMLDGGEYKAAIKLLDKGGELIFPDRRILIYRDMEIRKAIIEIEWIGI